MESKDKEELKKAMDEELSALAENETWKIVPRQEKAHTIGSKWIFATKKDSSGQI